MTELHGAGAPADARPVPRRPRGGDHAGVLARPRRGGADHRAPGGRGARRAVVRHQRVRPRGADDDLRRRLVRGAARRRRRVRRHGGQPGRPPGARRRHPQGRPARGLHRRRGPGPPRARGDGPVRREGRHGDAAHVRRRDAGRARRRGIAPRPALHRRGEGTAAPARAAGGDRDRQRAPVPPAAGAGAPPGHPARRQPGARRLRGPRRGALRPRSPRHGGRGRVRTPRCTSTGRTTTRSSTARSTRRDPRRPGVRDDALGTVYPLDRVPRGAGDPGGDRGGAGAPLGPRRSPTTGAGPWRTGDRRPASACRCARVEPPQGILRLTTTEEERRFTAHELQLLEALAESGGAAVHNARLFRAAGAGERAAARALRRQPPPHLDPRPARRR